MILKRRSKVPQMMSLTLKHRQKLVRKNKITAIQLQISDHSIVCNSWIFIRNSKLVGIASFNIYGLKINL